MKILYFFTIIIYIILTLNIIIVIYSYKYKIKYKYFLQINNKLFSYYKKILGNYFFCQILFF